MADYKAVNKTNRDAEPSVKAGVGEELTSSKFSYDAYTVAVALNDADTVTFMKIPKGARVLNVELLTPDLGGTGTIDLGWAVSADGVEAADDDGFGVQIDVSQVGGIHYRLSDQSGLPGAFKKFDAEVEVVATVEDANLVNTGGKIEVLIEYVMA
jgi:hypothetical protein